MNKIVESGLTKNAAMYRAVNMTTSIIPITKKRYNLIRMDFEYVFGTLKPILDIKVGDRIVIPKLSLRNNQNTPGKYFTVVDCTSPSLTITKHNHISASS